MTKSFYEAFAATIPATDIAIKDGFSYLSAATAVALAGRPQIDFVDFGRQPHLEMLGGAVVAVDLALPGQPDAKERMWLPVLDQVNAPVSQAAMTANSINYSHQRCLVKAIASVYGDGLSVFMNFSGDGVKAAKALGVTPETDIAAVEPVIAVLKEGGAPYIEWNTALAACRITDPGFRWRVLSYPVGYSARALPFREVLGGIVVDVETVYKGKSQVLSLVVMDAAFEPIPAAKATVFDWNKTVMRCLTKCIAFNTGYGLKVYAKDFGVPGMTGEAEKSDGKRGGKKGNAKDGAKATAEASTQPADAGQTPETPVTHPVTAEAPVETPVAETSVAETPAVEAAPVVETPGAAESETPAAPAAEVQAEAQAQAAVASAQASAQQEVAQPEYLGRFRSVIDSQREAYGVPGVIAIFGLLDKSKRYTAEEKPVCYTMLMRAAASTTNKETILQLLGEIKTYNGMQYVPAEDRDLLAGKFTAVALAAGCEAGNAELLQAAESLIAAGVAKDMDEVRRLAVSGKVPAETIDLLTAVTE